MRGTWNRASSISGESWAVARIARLQGSSAQELCGGVERGERNPSFESLVRWLDSVGVSWREFGDALERQSSR